MTEPGGPLIRQRVVHTRAAALAAVVAFAVAVTGVAVVAARSGGGSGLVRLPFAAAGGERDAAAMSLAAPAGVFEYVLEGTLPALPDEAPAYRLGDEGASGAAERVARALGVEADKVTVEPGPGLPWYLASAKSDQTVSSCAVELAPDRPTIDRCFAPPPVPDLPSKADAERLARRAFELLGLPVDGLELLGGTHSWDAVVSPSVDGLPTRGLETGVSIGPRGEITGAHGYLGKPDRIGDYPLVGADAGLARLRQGVGIGPQPLGDIDTAVGGVEPQVVTVTGARLALMHVGELLVPVYEFLTRTGGFLTAPAVTDRWLKEQQRQTREPSGIEPGRVQPDRGESGSGSCSASVAAAGATGDAAADNAPLTVQVCVEPARARVGEEVVFTVTAVDPDAPVIDSDCGSPTVAFGDGQPPASNCMIGCTLAKPLTPKKTPKEPGKASRTFTHAYDRPGTFTATFGFQSGPCTEWSNSGQGSIDVVIAK